MHCRLAAGAVSKSVIARASKIVSPRGNHSQFFVHRFVGAGQQNPGFPSRRGDILGALLGRVNHPAAVAHPPGEISDLYSG